MAPASEKQSADCWVFGYGSLMWNPGFSFAERRTATLDGYHRAFCVYSHHYRGTPETPGLVLGLDRGGRCRGMAFRVTARGWSDVVAYLDERELIGYAYQPASLAISFDNGRTVEARTYVADPAHPHFAGALDEIRAAAMIVRAVGISGSNRDYAINLIGALEQHGFVDRHLHALLARVGAEAPNPGDTAVSPAGA